MPARHSVNPHLVGLGVMRDDLKVVKRHIVVVTVILPVLIHCAKHDASSTEDTPEQSGSDEVDVLPLNQARVVDIADERVRANAVKPATHHVVDFGMRHSDLKGASLNAFVGDDDCFSHVSLSE